MQLITNATIQLDVLSVAPSVEILKPQGRTYTIRSGEELALVCHGHGDPKPAIVWKREVGTELMAGVLVLGSNTFERKFRWALVWQFCCLVKGLFGSFSPDIKFL